MDLNLLPLFLLVAETSSFSVAAEKTGVRRSSVSRAIATLEESLGVQLFNRTTRKVALTSAGKAFHATVAAQVSGLLESIGQIPEREEEPSGHLRITAPDDIGGMVLPQIVTAFSLRYPAVSVDVHASNRIVDLVSEGFDLALRVTMKRMADSSLVAKKLSELPMHIFASPAYLARAGTPRRVGDTASHEWVWFKQVKLPAPLPAPKKPPRITGENVVFLRNALRSGAGLGPLPAFLAAEDVASGTLVRVLPKLSIASGTLYFVHPPSQHIPRKVTAFRDFLVDHLAKNPFTG